MFWQGIQLQIRFSYYPHSLKLGFRVYGGFLKLGVPSLMENQMGKKMEHQMETGGIQGFKELYQQSTQWKPPKTGPMMWKNPEP